MDRLTSYDWPGNVRELANVLERAVILCQGDVVLAEHLGALSRPCPPPRAFSRSRKWSASTSCARSKRRAACSPGPQGAARLLGMSRSTALVAHPQPRYPAAAILRSREIGRSEALLD